MVPIAVKIEMANIVPIASGRDDRLRRSLLKSISLKFRRVEFVFAVVISFVSGKPSFKAGASGNVPFSESSLFTGFAWRKRQCFNLSFVVRLVEEKDFVNSVLQNLGCLTELIIPK